MAAAYGVFFPFHSVFVPSAPSGMGILKALPGYYSSVRSVPGMGLAVYLDGYASSSSSPTVCSRTTERPLAPIEEPREWRWQRLLVVHVHSRWTARSKWTYVIHQTLFLCVLYSHV